MAMVTFASLAIVTSAFAADFAAGTTVNLQGPAAPGGATYYYLWTADIQGATSTGTDQSFSVTMPTLDAGAAPVTVPVTLLVTDGYGCINETSAELVVYSNPGCGIQVPEGICQEAPTGTFTYTGENIVGSDSTYTFTWLVDGAEAATVSNDAAYPVDWSGLTIGDHDVVVRVVKTSPAGFETSTECPATTVKFVETPQASISFV